MNDPSTESQETFLGHPKGLYILFFTEMWERYSYYGMRALLTLFLTATITSENPGYGWNKEMAFALYGWYTMLVYVMSIPGGIFADKVLGQKRAVMLGGILLVFGHLTLAINAPIAFYTGLGLIILGVGFLKPNISTMVGGLYRKGDDRRDLGFYIFYIGINLGAFAAGLTIGPLGEDVNWHYGFGLAGIGMFIGQIIYVWGQRYLVGIGDPPQKANISVNRSVEPSMLRKLLRHKTAFVVTALIITLGLYMTFSPIFILWQIMDHIGYGILILALSLFVGFGMVIYSELDHIEKDRVIVLLLSFLIVVVFWGAFEQAGGLMNVYARDKTDRLINPFWIDIFFVVMVLIGLIQGVIKKRKGEATAMAWIIGSILAAVGLFAVRFYFITTNPWEVPATVFQSVNSFFIFTLATMIGAFWYRRHHKGKESSSLFKMGVGVVIMGWGFFFMAAAYSQYESIGSSAMYWLILAYLFHTVGELCLSPVSLSFITKLAPVKYASIMMGTYFAFTGFGNKLAGILGELSQSAGEFQIFMGIAIFCTIVGLLVVVLIKPLKRLSHGAEDIIEAPQ